MLLLAYSDPRDSPAASLLNAEHRKETAGKLNAAILSVQRQEQCPQLPMMLRMMQWAQEQLHERKRVSFPKIHNLLEAIPVICRPTTSTSQRETPAHC